MPRAERVIRLLLLCVFNDTVQTKCYDAAGTGLPEGSRYAKAGRRYQAIISFKQVYYIKYFP